MSETIGQPFSKAEIDAIRQAEGRSGAGADGDEARVKAGFWAKVKRVGRNLPFVEDAVAAYYCALDPATPTRVKVILLSALAYFVLPLDALADFLPLLGFADDAAVLMAAITEVAGAINPGHREKARQALSEEGSAEL
jgi:uncharacterized membrane protein YkvA (DUF1232 family)